MIIVAQHLVIDWLYGTIIDVWTKQLIIAINCKYWGKIGDYCATTSNYNGYGTIIISEQQW